MMNVENVYIFLFNGFSDWEIAYITPELRKSKKATLSYFTIDGLQVTSMGGLNITPDLSMEQLDSNHASMLILPGGTAWEEQSITEIDRLVETLYANNKTIAAVCAATTYLGQKGYLDQVKHTSNALAYLKEVAPAYKGEKDYQDDFSVTDQNIITANGTAPIEFAREIFKKINLHNEEDIERWFQLFKHGLWIE